MRPTRRFRLITVILSLWALLFAQVALAAYECKGLGQGSEPMEMQASTPCAESIPSQDRDVGLCHAHCQASGQQADTYQPPVFASSLAFAPARTVVLASTPASPVPPPSPQLRRSGSPPISVRNCCFRI